jgi:outer membrane protein
MMAEGAEMAGRMRKHAATALLLVIGAVPAAAQQPAMPTLTMEEVIARALEHSPQVAQATGSVQTATSAERTALGAFLPNLSFSSGASLSSSQRFDERTNTFVSGSNDSYNAGLSTGVDLFTGGRRGAELSRSRANTDAAQAALIEQRYAVTRNAKVAYYDVLRATDVIRAAEARQQRAREALDAAERRQQVGSATRSDVLRAQLEMTNSRQAVLQAANQKRSATFALGAMVGVDGPADAAAADSMVVAELPFTQEQLLEMALAQSPSVVSAMADERAADATVKVARAQYMPSLNTSGSYRWSNDVASFNNARGSWSLSLGLNLPVFNRFAREDSYERARVQARVAGFQLADAQRQVRAQLEQMMGALETARQQIELAQQSLSVAQEDMRVQEERYRMGVSTILERVTSQENLVGAESAVIAARYDYQLALATLESLIGREL